MNSPSIESLTSFFTQLFEDVKDPYQIKLKKEELLTLKLGLNINKVHIKQSKIHGNGLFSSVNIKKGEIITLYPCDVLAYYPDKDRTKDYYVSYIYSELLNENVNLKNKFDQNRKYYKNYQLSVNDDYSIIGLPEYDNDPTYMGHICNDGARGHTIADKKIYETVSILKSNACYRNICDCMMAIVAIRDIEINEEILVTYGHGYWLTH
jgi:SET domain-containing protein